MAVKGAPGDTIYVTNKSFLWLFVNIENGKIDHLLLEERMVNILVS